MRTKNILITLPQGLYAIMGSLLLLGLFHGLIAVALPDDSNSQLRFLTKTQDQETPKPDEIQGQHIRFLNEGTPGHKINEDCMEASFSPIKINKGSVGLFPVATLNTIDGPTAHQIDNDLKWIMSRTFIVPAYHNHERTSQWVYDQRTQTLKGQTLERTNPPIKTPQIGFMGATGFSEQKKDALPLGKYIRFHMLSAPQAGDLDQLLWLTTKGTYLLDLNSRTILWKNNWTPDQYRISVIYKPTLKKTEIASATTLIHDSGEWLVWTRTSSGKTQLHQGPSLPGKGRFILTDNDLYFQTLHTIRKKDHSLLKAALYQVDSNHECILINRRERSFPSSAEEVIKTSWPESFFLRGTAPLIYSLLEYQLRDEGKIIRQTWSNANARTRLKVKFSERIYSYAHAQLFWTAAALAGMMLYLRKRKSGPLGTIIWAMIVVALGLAGLFAYWIANRPKKGTESIITDLPPQQLRLTD